MERNEHQTEAVRLSALERSVAEVGALIRKLGRPNLRDLLDADLTKVTDGQVPAYDKATGTWKPATAGGGGGYAATVTVAASDASASSKAAADFVCDGVDDQEEINLALDICHLLHEAGGDLYSPGGRVLLSEGTFVLGRLGIDSGFPRHGFFGGQAGSSLQGQGMTATVLKHTGSIKAGFAVENYGEGFRLSDLTIDSTGILDGGYGVYLEADHQTVERVRFVNVGYQSYANLHIGGQWARVQDCEFLGGVASAGVYLDDKHSFVTGCYFEDTPYQAIYGETTASGGGFLVVTHNIIRFSQALGGATAQSDAIRVGDNSIVTNNIIRDDYGQPATIISGTGSVVANNVLL